MTIEANCEELLKHMKRVRPNGASVLMTITLWAHPSAMDIDFCAAVVSNHTKIIPIHDTCNPKRLVYEALSNWYDA